MPFGPRDYTPDARSLRAHQIVAMIMQIISPHLRDDRNSHRDASRALTEALHKEGAELVTDYARREHGLPPRGPQGWTTDELVAMEERRLEFLRRPIPPMIFEMLKPDNKG